MRYNRKDEDDEDDLDRGIVGNAFSSKKKSGVGEVKKYLRGLKYPQDKRDLVDYAESKEAPARVLDALRKIPSRRYANEDDVMDEIDLEY